MAAREPVSVGPEPDEPAEDFTRYRLDWLVRLRWVAMAGIVSAAVVAKLGVVPGVSFTGMLLTAAAGTVFNFLLWRTQKEGDCPCGPSNALAQAIVDIVLLTFALWSAGGVETPFVGFYVFHVAIIGLLAGPRATLLGAGIAGAGAGFLALEDALPVLRIAVWNPVPPWHLVANALAFFMTVGAVAYVVTHAMRELRDRERALARARDRAALEYELLSTTLHQLEAGLEVVDTDGLVIFRNKRAEALVPEGGLHRAWSCPGASHPCEKGPSGVCPIEAATHQSEGGRCRFAADIDGSERVYELLVYPLAQRGRAKPRMMNLYVDRTAAVLAERRLVMAERLASLGRVAQGVAHELNTPLATIRTLASDTRAALRSLDDATDADTRRQLVKDLDESAELVQDETRRLGRITQSLLAGGDLVRTQIDGAVPLSAVVERARALVFAGVRSGPSVEVGVGVDELAVSADPDRVVQVLVNLLQNAYDAVRDREDAHVTIAARCTPGGVEVVVEDDGPGIDPAIETRLFEPFATTKPPGQGTGLGLYTSYMLVQAMQGALTLERREEGGTRATLRLPAAAPVIKRHLAQLPAAG